MRFTAEHEWLTWSLDDEVIVVGITEYATKQLGDIVFIELPSEGDSVIVDDEIAVIESVKAASGIFAVCDGIITEVNTYLESSPETINEDPFGSWIYKVKLKGYIDMNNYMTEGEYKEYCG